MLLLNFCMVLEIIIILSDANLLLYVVFRSKFPILGKLSVAIEPNSDIMICCPFGTLPIPGVEDLKT